MIDPKDLKVGDKVICRAKSGSDCLTVDREYDVRLVNDALVKIQCDKPEKGDGHFILSNSFDRFDKVESDFPPKFKDLPREEQLALVEAALDGRNIEVYLEPEQRWVHDTLISVILRFHSDQRYRIADEKPVADDVIPWHVLDERWQYAARDVENDAFIYTDKPVRADFGWIAHRVDSVRITDLLADYKPGTCGWRDSLQQRPEGV